MTAVSGPVYGVRVPDREPTLAHQIIIVFASRLTPCLDGTVPHKNDVMVSCNCHSRDSVGHVNFYIGPGDTPREAWRRFNQPAFHDRSRGEFIPNGRMLMKYGVVETDRVVWG